jgi:hypothetical protein
MPSQAEASLTAVKFGYFQIPIGDVAIFHSFRRNFHRRAADNFWFSLKLWPV